MAGDGWSFIRVRKIKGSGVIREATPAACTSKYSKVRTLSPLLSRLMVTPDLGCMEIDHQKFFEGFKSRIINRLSQDQVDGIEFLLTSFAAGPLWSDIRWISYALATIYHETARSMQPVEEGYYLGDAARVQRFQKQLRYYPYFGRGYVQLTWDYNYKKAGDKIGVDLIDHPELALAKENAFPVLTHGMIEGWFTGHKLHDYIHDSFCDYVNARRIINGTDKAVVIARYAERFQQILKDSETDS